MSDRFDRAMADIAIESASNGGPKIPDVLTAMKAAHEDSIEAAEKIALTVESVAKALKGEVADAVKQRKLEIAESARVIKKDLDDYHKLVVSHLENDVRMSNKEFVEFMNKVREERATEIERIENDIVHIQDNCNLLHVREPRREGDDEKENWGASLGDSTVSDGWQMIFAWRFTKWFVGAAILLGADIVAHRISGMGG